MLGHLMRFTQDRKMLYLLLLEYSQPPPLGCYFPTKTHTPQVKVLTPKPVKKVEDTAKGIRSLGRIDFLRCEAFRNNESVFMATKKIRG